ncbi:hypothetical protein DFH06DRAFT_1200996 [Mycena polygramma]|nr:hypothetical protein DFH06DRAFT_1200996 [Mycena polygramma]
MSWFNVPVVSTTQYKDIEAQINSYRIQLRSEKDRALKKATEKELAQYLAKLHGKSSGFKAWLYGYMATATAQDYNTNLARAWERYRSESTALAVERLPQASGVHVDYDAYQPGIYASQDGSFPDRYNSNQEGTSSSQWPPAPARGRPGRPPSDNVFTFDSSGHNSTASSQHSGHSSAASSQHRDHLYPFPMQGSGYPQQLPMQPGGQYHPYSGAPMQGYSAQPPAQPLQPWQSVFSPSFINNHQIRIHTQGQPRISARPRLSELAFAVRHPSPR